MPSPKSGTVTFEVAQASRTRKPKDRFRVDRAGILHVPIGRKSFDPMKLRDNMIAIMDAVMRRTVVVKRHLRQEYCYISTMGPGIKIDRVALLQTLAG